MAEKHINKITREQEELKKHYGQNTSAEDEWSHITGVGTKIDAADPMAVTDRMIIFGRDQVKSTKAEVIKEKSEEFMDQINNTNQYLKFVNAHLVEKKNKLDKLKEAEKRFKEEIESLQADKVKPRDELEKVNYKYVTEADRKSLLVHLENEKNHLKEKISYHAEQLEKTRKEIDKKEEQIQYLKHEIENATNQQSKTADPLKVIEQELARLGVKDNSKIREAMDILSKKLR